MSVDHYENFPVASLLLPARLREPVNAIYAFARSADDIADEGEAAVGARGLTGPGYRGHVFWDSDVFVLPFLAATHPAAARAMLEYRLRRLPAARAIANGTLMPT